MFENLNQPYIFNNNFKHSVKTIILVSMAYMLIVLYFQPFGINFLKSTRDAYFVLGTGIFTAITFFVNTQVLPGIFPKTFDSNKWTVRKEIIQNICMFTFLSFSFGLLAYFFGIAFINYSLPIFLTGALALLPILLFNLSNYNNSLKVKMVHVFDSGKHWLNEEKRQSANNVKFVSESGKESMQFDPDKLLLLKSCGNYVEIYYTVDQRVKKSLLRQTLSNIENLLVEYPNFVRAHRCCLINFSHYSKMTNLSGTYSLQLKGLDIDIPIARGKVLQIKSLSQAIDHTSSVQ
jgi:hypothetical protein